MEKVLDRFGMKEAKPVQTPIAQHFKLSSSQCPTTDKEKKSMRIDTLFKCSRMPYVLPGVHKT